jgi:hypothetical protein
VTTQNVATLAAALKADILSTNRPGGLLCSSLPVDGRALSLCLSNTPQFLEWGPRPSGSRTR